ncbi:MAG: acyl-CoA dehydrogenase family protein [candidate division KSB1 bacterium]|nr:acyl-CoA dehydrogenase family protein [candidate division KSB1 bacterium]
MSADTTVLKGGEFLARANEPDGVLVPEDFNDEIRMIAQTTVEFIQNEVVPVMDRLEKLEPGLSESLLRKAGELGLHALEIPEEYGGANLPKLASMVVAEKLAGAGGFNTTISAHHTIGTLPTVYFGNEEQKKKYLPRLATAEIIGAYALTEPQAGSDALGGRTQAVLSEDGQHWILNGTKMWITNAGFADLFTVFAKVDGDRKKFSAFLVERTFEGLSTGHEEKKMGIKSSSTRQVIFENVKVPRENLLGEVGQGAKIAFNILNTGRFKLGAGCVGGTKQIISIASKYAKERVQFGVPIASFGLIQEKLAEMTLRTYAVESAVYRTAGLIDAAVGDNKDPQHQLQCIEEYAVECSIIKVMGSEVLDYAADEGLQIHGGYGYSQDYEIERIYRDSRINRIYEGTNEINRLIIPDMLLKRSLRGHLPLLAEAEKVYSRLGDAAPASGSGMDLARQLIDNAKTLTLLLLGGAAQALGENLRQEQEVAARIADMVMATYAADSAWLRTMRLKNKGVATPVHEAMVQVYVEEAMARINRWAHEAAARFLSGDQAKQVFPVIDRLTAHVPFNTVALRREIADAVLKAEAYPYDF